MEKPTAEQTAWVKSILQQRNPDDPNTEWIEYNPEQFKSAFLAARNQKEKHLEEALDTPGFLISIVGPSKSDKTALCERVIPRDKMILFNGTDFKHQDDFWTVVAKKLNMPLETYKDRVLQEFLSRDLVMVWDDFHDIDEEMQIQIAYELKDAIRRGLRAIVLHRTDNLIHKNPDLNGRVIFINIER